MVSSFVSATATVRHTAVNACLMPLCSVDQCAVVTVEGVGSTKRGLHPVQQRMTSMHGSQCGFCTPGIVMAMYTLFRNNADTTVAELEEHMDGNLCRCTGYRPILDAGRSLCIDVERCEQACGLKDGCASGADGGCGGCVSGGKRKSTALTKGEVATDSADKAAHAEASTPYSKTGAAIDELPFPDELSRPLEPVVVRHGGKAWWRPDSLAELLALKAVYPAARLVVGNTEVGIESRFKGVCTEVLLCPAAIPELLSCEATAEEYIFGACAPLSEVSAFCEAAGGAEAEGGASTIAVAIRDMLRWFASTQIRNVACLGGNLATASPISDMNPLLMAAGASLCICSAAHGERRASVKDFFKGYRRVDLADDEIIVRIHVPITRPHEFVMPLKQARRREDDISIVTAGLRVRLQLVDEGWVVEEASFAYGGMAPTTVLAKKTARALAGHAWGDAAFKVACAALEDELRVPAGAPGGQSEYRTALSVSFLFKLYVSVSLKLGLSLSPRESSAARSFVHEHKPSARGMQRYPLVHNAVGLEDKPISKASQITPSVPQPEQAEAEAAALRLKAYTESFKAKGVIDAAELVMGAALPHASGALHTTGEATYVDDIKLPAGTRHGCLVRARRAPARLIAIDAERARAAEGVIAVLFAADLPGENDIGPIVHDEECFAAEAVYHIGQVIGIAVAETAEQARVAAEMVAIEYEALSPAVVSIEQAIAAGSFFAMTEHSIESGPDVNAALTQDGVVCVEGEFRMGGQEHFYLECGTTLALPSEGALELISSTQAVTKVQAMVAHVCGIPANKVVSKVKRMGGGFGGKETRTVFASCACAVAAHVLGVPVRLSLTRDVDMSSTGGRHAFVVKYRAAAWPSTAGPSALKLAALDAKLYSNGGACLDLSGPVLDRALMHIDNCYSWPALRVWGVVCKTAQPPHTAFRGFGGPQGMLATEAILDHLASALGVPVTTLRDRNFYTEHAKTHFGQALDGGDWRVPRAWKELKERVDFERAHEEAAAFNSANTWRKRGVALVPTKYGINFTAKFMNQGGALVHLYTDGTVLVTHGGTEMGQGLHTKVAQVAAKAFGIPLSMVHIAETATDKVANTQPTAASMSTDLYGMATLDACRQIIARLAPLRAAEPSASLASLARRAFFARVDLSAHGFYKVDDKRCGYDWSVVPPRLADGTLDNAARGTPFNYFTQGVGFAEVEIDVLTGDHEVRRVELLVDIGSAINPAIDIGQIEGAFMQGMGWTTTEELIWADQDHAWVQPAGRLLTQGPGAYKIPSFNDTPRVFNVSLMTGVANPFAVHSSKAVGEPPFFLGSAVFFAIRDAVAAARAEHMPQPSGTGDDNGHFSLHSPATSERIRMACTDRFAVSAIGGSSAEAFKAAASFQPKASV